MTSDAFNGYMIVEASDPFFELKDSAGGSAKDVQVRNKQGVVDLYDVVGVATLRTLYPEKVIVFGRHVPIKAADGAAEGLTTLFEEALFKVPPAGSYTVTDVGVIPDKLSTAFGAATNYFTLTLKNMTGAATIATKAFSAAATVQVATSLGSINNADIVAGDILVMVKSITSNGLVVQGCTYYLELTRKS